jgi:uncharacterized membrane protein
VIKKANVKSYYNNKRLLQQTLVANAKNKVQTGPLAWLLFVCLFGLSAVLFWQTEQKSNKHTFCLGLSCNLAGANGKKPRKVTAQGNRAR